MATQHLNQKGVTTFFKRLTLLYIAVVLVTVPMSADATDILLGTGAEGSDSHFTGRAICRNINRSAGDLNCRVIPAPDGIHNLTNLQQGSLDVALVDSRLLYDAVHQTGHFEFLDIRYDNLGLLLPLYDLPILLIARSDSKIDSLEQLKGKRINAGAPRSKEHQVVDLIMNAKGWSKKDFRIVQELPATLSQDTMAFCHGSIQAMVHIGVHPDSAVQKLMNQCDVVLLDMDDADITRLVDTHPAFSQIRIPATYAIMAALEKNQAKLKSIHPALGEFSVKRANGPDIGISLHPGADAYLSAQGK
ncbi:MAG: TAXI family TRAP transporter solute-binding subunit [Desulfosarcina sp.]|nr:TAXI family TRAP transporter solute-binding subunit [Desulfosarcina sp.]